MAKRSHRGKRLTCYACNRRATSRDHVPPRCFFPAVAHDGQQASLRKALITVPSCDEHNLQRSGDDQYLVSITTTYIENNDTARAVFDSVVMPTLRRRPWLAATFFRGLGPARVGPIQTGAYEVDRDRFDRAVAQIARGIHFHHFGTKATGSARVVTYNLVDVSSPKRDKVNAALAKWRRYSDTALASVPRHGENQSVFFYQVVADPEDHRGVVRMVFYAGLVVDIMFLDDSLAA